MWALFCNPKSAGGKGAQVKSALIELLRNSGENFVDLSGQDPTSASQNLKEFLGKVSEIKPKGVLVVGGDGMVSIAIQQLANTDIPMGLIPAGTGNDFARTLGLNIREPLSNFEVFLNKQPEYVDVGQANGRYFAEILSTGFDSLVNERANKVKLIKGRAKYNLAILLELPFFKAKSYEFTIDNVSFTSQAMLIAVSNGQSYGGGMKIAPMADIQDGFLDVMILGPVSKLEFIKVFPKVYEGAHVDHPAVKFMKGKNVSVTASAVAYADGERMGDLPIKATVKKDALLVWRK